VDRDFVLDAFDVDTLRLGPHRRQQVRRAGQAEHLVAKVKLVFRGQTLHQQRKSGLNRPA
jgi:hypothetical protein